MTPEAKVLDEVINLILKKNRVYGSENILYTGVSGVMTRLVDKCYRFSNIVTNNPENAFEPLSETLIDVIGYCIIGKCLIVNAWGASGPELEKYLRETMAPVIDLDYPYMSMDSLAQLLKAYSQEGFKLSQLSDGSVRVNPTFNDMLGYSIATKAHMDVKNAA